MCARFHLPRVPEKELQDFGLQLRCSVGINPKIGLHHNVALNPRTPPLLPSI